jgi:hypothetical protein
MQAMMAFNVVAAVGKGLAGRSEAMSEAARADSEARLADTQALQRDTLARDDLNRFLSSVRSSRAANGLSSRSPNAMVLEQEGREASDHNRLVQRADDRQRAANFRTAAKSARRKGRFSLITGIAKAGVPLAEYGSYQGWGS